MDEEARSAESYKRLAETAVLHSQGRAGLWGDPDLQNARDWRRQQQPNPAWASRYHEGFEAAETFLDKSSARRRRQRWQRLIAVAALVLAVLVAVYWQMWGKDSHEVSNLEAQLQELQRGDMPVADFDKQMDNARESIRDPNRLNEIKPAYLAVLLDSMEAAICKELNRSRAEGYWRMLLKNLPMAETLRRPRLQKIKADYDRRVKQPGVGLTPAISDTVKRWLDLLGGVFAPDTTVKMLLTDLAKRQAILDSLQVKIPKDKRFLIGNVPQRNVRLKIILQNADNLQAATIFMDDEKMPVENLGGQPHRTAFKTFSANSHFADSTKIIVHLHAVTADSIEVTRPATFLLKKLRSRAISDDLNFSDVVRMLIDFDFSDKWYNSTGTGFTKHFALGKDRFLRNGEVIIDRATGLIWQQDGSTKVMQVENTADYLAQLNAGKGFAGYRDWRLPTLEEAMSSMEPEKSSDGLYINSVFDKTQRWIWTADRYQDRSAWVASFDYGRCSPDFNGYGRVRAVRSGQ